MKPRALSCPVPANPLAREEAPDASVGQTNPNSGNTVGKEGIIKRTPVLERRIGRFRVPQAMLLEPNTGRAIFRDMIIMRAEANFVDDTLMVWADHPAFDILAPGSLVPEYVATITAPKGVPPRRHQDLVIQWKLMDDPGEAHDVSLVARLGREDLEK